MLKSGQFGQKVVSYMFLILDSLKHNSSIFLFDIRKF